MTGPVVAKGDRIELVAWAPSPFVDDNENVPPGTQGTVQAYNPRTDQIWVNWDNGSTLMVIISKDRWRVQVRPKPKEKT